MVIKQNLTKGRLGSSIRKEHIYAN
jgi:hypothetical protein